nr:MAG TPA: hypothetical protein [Caudoviricetes sp.]
MVSLIPLTVFRVNFMFSSLLMESTHCVTRCLRSICVLLCKALSKRHTFAVRTALAIRTRRCGHILQQRSLVCGVVGGHKLRLELKYLVHVTVSQCRRSFVGKFSVITLCNELLTVRGKGLFLDEVLLVGSQGFNLLLHLCQLVSLFLCGILVIGTLCLELLLVLGSFAIGFRHGVTQLLDLCARVCNLFKRRNDFIGGHALFVGITKQHIEFHIVNFLLRFFTVASLQRCEICIPASLPEYISPKIRGDSLFLWVNSLVRFNATIQNGLLPCRIPVRVCPFKFPTFRADILTLHFSWFVSVDAVRPMPTRKRIVMFAKQLFPKITHYLFLHPHCLAAYQPCSRHLCRWRPV